MVGHDQRPAETGAEVAPRRADLDPVPALRHRRAVELQRVSCAEGDVDLRQGDSALTWYARAWRVLRADPVLLASAIGAFLLVAAIVVGPPILRVALGHSSD